MNESWNGGCWKSKEKREGEQRLLKTPVHKYYSKTYWIVNHYFRHFPRAKTLITTIKYCPKSPWYLYATVYSTEKRIAPTMTGAHQIENWNTTPNASFKMSCMILQQKNVCNTVASDKYTLSENSTDSTFQRFLNGIGTKFSNRNSQKIANLFRTSRRKNHLE